MAFSSPHRPELWKCFTLLILSVLVFITRNFTETNTLPGLYFRCLSSLRGISKKPIRAISLYLRLFTKMVEIMHELKTGICYFWDDYGKVLSLIRFANDPFTLYNQLNACRLARIRKRWKSVNLGKTQCWALFVISKATFTKTAIKPKFDDRFSLKISVIQCTIKCPIFMSIVTF